MAAHLAKVRGEKVLVIDEQRHYCSDIRTLTLKEVRDVLQEGAPLRLKQAHYCPIGPAHWREGALGFIQRCEDEKRVGGYSLDLDPRLLFGASLPTSLMKDAEMDKYLEFIPVHNIYVLEEGVEHVVPYTKGDIFKSGLLSLREKKELYSSLQVMHQLGKRLSNAPDDPNSLN
jgi:RAB protein geranylgeranyltransferase component A